MAGIDVFLCYVRKDKAEMKELTIHLRGLKHQGILRTWSGCEVTAGKNKEQEINTHLSTAHIIVLLISPHSIGSDYFWVKMKVALERHDRGEARIVQR